MKSRLSFSNSPFMAAKKTCLSLLSALLVLSLFSCDPDDENEQDKASKSLQSLGFTVSVDNQNSQTRSSMTSADGESFTVCQWNTETGEALAENGDLVLTCDVTDISESAIGTTRGVPTGTTVPYSITDGGGSRPVIAATTTDVETVFGTKGLGVTIYKKEGASGTPALMTPNSDYATERNASIPSFNNVKYTGTVADGWSTAEDIDGYYWYWNYKLRLFGYAPYATSMSSATCNPTTGGMSFSYTIPSADPTGQEDLIVGSTDWLDRPAYDENDPNSVMNVILNTQHALSAIRIVVDNNYLKSDNTRRSKDFTINSITLEGLKNSGTCTYDGSDITWTPDLTTTSYSHTYSRAVTSTSSDDHEIDLQPDQTAIYFAIPQGLTSNAKFKVNFTRAGVTKEITAQLYGTGGSKGTTTYGSYLPGKMYTYTLSAKDISVSLFTFDTGVIEYTSGMSDKRVFGVEKSEQSDFSQGIANVTDAKTIQISWEQRTKGLDKIAFNSSVPGLVYVQLIVGNSLNPDGTIASPTIILPQQITINKEGFKTSPYNTSGGYYTPPATSKGFDMLDYLGTTQIWTLLNDGQNIPFYGVSATYNVEGYTYCQAQIQYYNAKATGSGSSFWQIQNINGSVIDYEE